MSSFDWWTLQNAECRPQERTQIWFVINPWHLFEGFPRACEARRQVKTINFWGIWNCDCWSFKSFLITFMSAGDSRQVSGRTECVLLRSLRSHICSKVAPWVPSLLFLDCDQTLPPLKPLCRVLIRQINTDAQGVKVERRPISGSWKVMAYKSQGGSDQLWVYYQSRRWQPFKLQINLPWIFYKW